MSHYPPCSSSSYLLTSSLSTGASPRLLHPHSLEHLDMPSTSVSSVSPRRPTLLPSALKASINLTPTSSSHHQPKVPLTPLSAGAAVSCTYASSSSQPCVVPSTGTPSLLPSGEQLVRLVNEIRLQSCSRSNFCANMVRQLYTAEERKSSNVKGKLGKYPLDPVRLASVRKSALEA